MIGYVYKIHDNTNGDDYYGSTIQTLKERLRKHKNDLNCSSKSIIQNGDYNMILVQTIQFENKKQLLELEKYYINNFNCVNKQLPFRTDEERIEYQTKYREEYYELNKDKINEYLKKYRENNKEKILEQKKEYYQLNKEKAKEYYQLNKDKIKEYREANKDKIKEKRKEKMTCKCGSIHRIVDISRHKKTKKHLIYINTINEIN